MSSKGRKSDYAILLTLAVLTAAAVSAYVLSNLAWESEEAQRVFRSTHSTNDEGAMASYLLFERLGYSVPRSEAPLLDESLKSLDVLFVVDPALPISEAEGTALEQWIVRGGVLVCAGGRKTVLARLHGISIRGEPPEAFGDGLPSRLGRDDLAKPLARDVTTIWLKGQAALVKDSKVRPGVGLFEPLLTDNEGVRIASLKVGTGRVVLLADSAFLANGWIGREDNAILAANLLSYCLATARGARFAFDEYHFGFGQGAGQTGIGFLAGLLVSTSPGWAVMCLTAAGLMYLFHKGRRFGTRRSPGREVHRSKVEFVRSVGATYQAAGAHRLAVGIIAKYFRKSCAARAGLPAAAPVDMIANALARRTGGSPERYRNALQLCERTLDQPRSSSRRGSAVLAKLAEIESEIIDGHSTRK